MSTELAQQAKPLDQGTDDAIHSDAAIRALYAKLTHPDALARFDKADGWFARYNGALADAAKAQKYLNGLRNTVCRRPGPLAGKAVLDVGCGFGMPCVTMAMLGATAVHGIDTNQKMLDTINTYLPEVPVGDRIEVQTGRAYALPYDDNSFDVVLMFEALSHFLKPNQCIEEGLRVLKPGGWLIVADDNNGANSRFVRENTEIWKRFELGPATAGSERVNGHVVLEPYVDKRRRIIERTAPDLDAASVERLVTDTCYLMEGDVEEAARTFVRNGTTPQSRFRPDRCPVEPTTGQYIENLLHPIDYANAMRKLDCDVEVEAYFGGHGKEGIVLLANNLLNTLLPRPWLVRVSNGFRLYAHKTA